jgi:uncharacterized repeat protein (TIGR03943 family)
MIDRIARQIAYFAPAAVMSAWATVMLRTIASGHINRLLSPMFRSYVLTAAIILVILSVLYLLLYQPVENTASPVAPTGRLRQIGRWLVLLIPVVAASVLAPSAFSSTTLVNRAALDSTAGVTPMPTYYNTKDDAVKAVLAASPDEPAPVEVTDLITLSQSPAQMTTFTGRKVRTVGYIMEKPGSAPKVVRLMMWCCAADAQPVSVELGGKTDGDWKDSQWYEITGTAQFPSTLGHVTPRIDVESIKPTQEPDEPFLSP